MLVVEGIVNSIFDSMTWLLSDSENDKVWLVDCGDINRILEKAGRREISGVLLTHVHFDHIYGLPELLDCYPRCMLYTNKSGKETLANSKLNLSFYHEHPIEVDSSQVQVCGEGDEIVLIRGFKAKVFETPGHHPSCITYLLDNYLFTGDSYIPGVKVVSNLPGADKKMAIESLERIVALAQKRTICPGHFV